MFSGEKMAEQDRQSQLEKLLTQIGWDPEQVAEVAREEADSPYLENFSFLVLAESLFCAIHETTWVEACREADPDGESDVVRRLLDAGASAEDLALFARMMQRRYASDLGCLLDGAGLIGVPQVPCREFGVFALDEAGEPTVRLEDLHEALSAAEPDEEMEISRRYADWRD